MNNIILFDGLCNLCNRLVIFILKRDRNRIFKFAPLQSERGQQILASFNLNISEINPDTFILISDNQALIKSTAALKLLKQLCYPCKFFYLFIIIPRPVRDFIYDLIARHRYRLFGQRSQCLLPDKSYIDRFLN